MSHLLARLKQLKKSILERRIVKLDHELCHNCSIKLHKEFGVKGGGKMHKQSKQNTKGLKKHFMRIPIPGKKNKFRKQAYVILKDGRRKFVKN